MKIGIIARPNEKGQIVIPKEIRDKLGIDSTSILNISIAGAGIYVHPVDAVYTKTETKSAFLAILEKTKGALAHENWIEWEEREKNQRKVEAAAVKNKKAW